MVRGIKIIVIVVFTCVLIRLFLGEPCYIPSESMEPTLCTGDWVWVDKASCGALLPDRFADIPLLNVFTWITFLREKDLKNNWNLGRMPAASDVYKRQVCRDGENRKKMISSFFVAWKIGICFW